MIKHSNTTYVGCLWLVK